ncbi:MAG: glycosyltransferase family 1 protein [Rhodospirillaceae bacterium]|nr:MAG: glycosyltransferase family 1 protein [Rhodospirillaceae bacterium]
MKILLNLVPLKSGGGVQVGLDFVAQARSIGGEHEWGIVATEGTPFTKLAESHNIKILAIIGSDIASRVSFELFGIRRLVASYKPDIVYTQFGPTPWLRGVTNVVGCAYWNLFYPELDAWVRHGFVDSIKKRITDAYRSHSLKRADALIVESAAIVLRAQRIHGLPAKKIFHVQPSISSLVSPDRTHAAVKQLCDELPGGFRVLMLSGYRVHKNIELVPRIARQLRQLNRNSDIRFILTLRQGDQKTIDILHQAAQLGVSDMIDNIGPVPAEGCAELYRSCDAVILPSRGESVSNNVMESWIMERPLVVSDLEWARSACGPAAIYFEFDNEHDAAMRLAELRERPDLYSHIVQLGREELKKYNTPAGRYQQYVDVMQTIHQAGSQGPRITDTHTPIHAAN